MAKSSVRRRSTSKRKKVKAPPPPPPIPRRIHTREDLDNYVLNHQGSALLVVITPLCTTCTNIVIPFVEQLNGNRPAALKETNLAVLYAGDDTSDMCLELEVKSAPHFRAYSYGTLVHAFSGDNLDKVMLLVKMAAQAAVAEAARLADIAKKEAAGIQVEAQPATAV